MNDFTKKYKIKTKSKVKNRSKSKFKSKKRKKDKKYSLNKLEFKKKDIIGEGTFSEVYRFRYKNKVDSKYVIKKIKVKFLRQFYNIDEADDEILKMFLDEVNSIVELSSEGITPKIYGQYIDMENDILFYVLQKLDYTLGHILRKNEFKPKMTEKIINAIEMLLKTKYRHVDLHIDNMMFDKKKNRFYLIDFGKQQTLTKKDSDELFYTLKSDKDYALFDFSKELEQSIIGSSGYSVIAIIFLILFKDRSHIAKLQLKKIKSFIKKYVPPGKYDTVINTLESQKLDKI